MVKCISVVVWGVVLTARKDSGEAWWVLVSLFPIRDVPFPC